MSSMFRSAADRWRSLRQRRDTMLGELGAADLLQGLDASDHAQIAVTQIRAVYALSATGTAMGLPAPALLTWVVGALGLEPEQTLQRWVWCGAITAFILLLLVDVVVFLSGAAASATEQTLRAGRRLCWLAVAYGALWGLVPLPMPTDGQGVPHAVVLVALSLTLTASANLAVFRPMVVCYTVSLTTCFTAATLATAGTDGWPVIAGFWMLCGAIVAYSRVQSRSTSASIALRLQAQRLLERVTAQQQLTEQALREAQASRESAERANRGKSTFLAAASHDLRQPMHALVQYFGHLQRRNRDPALDETIARIDRALAAQQDLLDSILEISKLMMGAVRPNLRQLPSGELVERLDAQLRPIAEGKGLDFEIRCEPVVLHIDDVLLERILRNLILNAVRYTLAGRVMVRGRRRGSRLRIEVWDTGIGIERRHRQQVFEEFFQVGNTARDSRKGLGLGLSLVRQLCDLMALRLTLRSRPGRGSMFAVEVPLGEPLTAPPPAPPADTEDFVRGAFIVLIDDHAENLQATAQSLALMGARVLQAGSSLAALDLLHRQEWMPHIVISDYRLGEHETGIEAIRTVVDNQRALYGDEFEIPAIVVTGDTSPVELARVRAAGHVLLHKPVRFETLYEAVNTALERLVRPPPL